MTNDKVARAIRLFRIIDDVARMSEREVVVGSDAEDGHYFCFFGCGVEWAVWRDAGTFPKEADHNENCPWRLARENKRDVDEEVKKDRLG